MENSQWMSVQEQANFLIAKIMMNIVKLGSYIQDVGYSA